MNGLNIVGPSDLAGPKENSMNFAAQLANVAIQDWRMLFWRGTGTEE